MPVTILPKDPWPKGRVTRYFLNNDETSETEFRLYDSDVMYALRSDGSIIIIGVVDVDFWLSKDWVIEYVP